MVVESTNGGVLSLVSVDLGALYSTSDAWAYTVVGFLDDGIALTTTGFVTNLATVVFDAAWHDLLAVPVRTSSGVSGAMDNVVVDVPDQPIYLPEPDTLWLLAGGLIVFGFVRRKRVRLA